MPRAGLTTDTVVRAAADLADEVGFEATTLSTLARVLGVRVASLYSHVEGSTGLREGVAALALGELADLAAEAVAGRSERDALEGYTAAYRDFARRHPGRYAATRLRVGADSPVVAVGRRHAALALAVLRGYGLDEADTVHAVRLLGSLVHGFTELELSGGFDHSEPSPEESWRRALDGLDATLRSWSVSRQP